MGDCPLSIFKEQSMLNPKQVEETLRLLLAEYIDKHNCFVDWSIIDCTNINNKKGIYIDPLPFVGEIVEYSDQIMIVKTKATEYMAVALEYVTCKPKIGTKVVVTPYARRQFDGSRCDRYEAEVQGTECNKQYVIKREALYPMDNTYFPTERPGTKSSLFRQLIKCIQLLFAPHGLRNVVHVLVDANAKNFRFYDPAIDYGGSYPYLQCDVDTSKFKGFEKIWIYPNGYEFGISLGRDNLMLGTEVNISYEVLGEKLEELIDDGSWRKIEVEILDN